MRVRPSPWHVVAFAVLVVSPVVLLVIATVTYSAPVVETALAPAGQATSLTLLEPAPGAVVDGRRVVVRVRVDGDLARPEDVPTNTAEGLVHIHLQLDGGEFDTPEHSASPLIAQENSEGSYSGMASTTMTYRDLPPGRHELRAELVANDHDPGGDISSASPVR